MKHLEALALVLSLLGAGGCASRPPTIAHVHIGHAITGVHVTPNQEGYMVTAERRVAKRSSSVASPLPVMTSPSSSGKSQAR